MKIQGRNIPDENIYILEEGVDLNLFKEFFTIYKRIFMPSSQHQKHPSEEECRGFLLSAAVPFSRKKELLVILSMREEISALRLLEELLNDPKTKENLKPWLHFALHHSKIRIENALGSDNEKFYIITGLGGLGKNLRFCVFFSRKEEVELQDFQLEMLKKETEFALEQAGGKLEDILYKSPHFIINCLIPIGLTYKEIFEKVLTEMKQYGDFLESDIWATNVKTLKFEEINRILKQMNKNKHLGRGEDSWEVRRKFDYENDSFDEGDIFKDGNFDDENSDGLFGLDEDDFDDFEDEDEDNFDDE